MVTPKKVAQWLLQQLEREREIYQEEIVYEIENRFGQEFVYINDNGNLAIDRQVLKEFRNLTVATVVWERGERMWRFREPNDPPDRRQADY